MTATVHRAARHPGPVAAPVAALVMLASVAVAACSAPATAGYTGAPASAADRGTSADGGSGGTGGPAITAPTRPRDGDVTDVGQLASTVAATATGDPGWIDVFSRLRARSWLATRYPGRYDLDQIYRQDAAETARANEEQHLALGVYLDEPLPRLVSVAKTRDLGELVELEVVLDAGPATVRGDTDDMPRGVLPGGTHRGLFTLGKDGPDDAWRIHSVTELVVGSRTTGQEPQ